MSRRQHLHVALLALVACGSGGSGGGAPPGPDSGDSSMVPEAGMTTGSEASAEAEAAAAPEAGGGPSEASASEASVNEGGAGGSDAAGEAKAGPFLGSMPAPATSALLRFANWSPDSPPVDICIAAHGSGAFQGPLTTILGSATGTDAGSAGVPFPFVTAYATVSPGQYDARLVVAGAGGCSVPIGHDWIGLGTLAIGQAETIALIGQVAPMPGSPKLAVSSLPDDVSGGASALVRAFNAAPGMAFADVGTGTLGAKSFSRVFRVPFGQAGGAVGDPNGYAPVTLNGALLSAHATGSTTDAVVSSAAVTVIAGAVVTLAVVGGGGAPSDIVECVDNAGTAGVFGNCCALGAGTCAPGN